jgi:hypothetical protein
MNRPEARACRPTRAAQMWIQPIGQLARLLRGLSRPSPSSPSFTRTALRLNSFRHRARTKPTTASNRGLPAQMKSPRGWRPPCASGSRRVCNLLIDLVVPGPDRPAPSLEGMALDRPAAVEPSKLPCQAAGSRTKATETKAEAMVRTSAEAAHVAARLLFEVSKAQSGSNRSGERLDFLTRSGPALAAPWSSLGSPMAHCLGLGPTTRQTTSPESHAAEDQVTVSVALVQQALERRAGDVRCGLVELAAGQFPAAPLRRCSRRSILFDSWSSPRRRVCAAGVPPWSGSHRRGGGGGLAHGRRAPRRRGRTEGKPYATSS